MIGSALSFVCPSLDLGGERECRVDRSARVSRPGAPDIIDDSTRYCTAHRAMATVRPKDPEQQRSPSVREIRFAVYASNTDRRAGSVDDPPQGRSPWAGGQRRSPGRKRPGVVFAAPLEAIVGRTPMFPLWRRGVDPLGPGTCIVMVSARRCRALRRGCDPGSRLPPMAFASPRSAGNGPGQRTWGTTATSPNRMARAAQKGRNT